jgi:hypothetical protein
MIQLSANVQALLSQGTIELFYLLHIAEYNLDKSALNVTSFYSDVSIVGDRTYLGNGNLVAISPPKLESVVDKSSFDITISDPQFSEANSLEVNLLGNLVELRAGVVNTVTNLPLLALADTLLIYRGKVDAFSYKASTKELGENLLVIRCGSPMVNLDAKRSFYLNKDFVRRTNPSDSSCDQINEGSGSLMIKWGKA